jgi:hypothetical protein
MNQMYDDARERLLKAQLNWQNLTLVLLAFDLTSYSYVSTHLTQANIGTPVGVSQTLTSPLVSPGGYARTNAGVFIAIPVGPSVKFLVLAEQHATPANRRLIAYTNIASGLPFTPNGGDWVVKPDWANSQGWWRA